MSEWSAEAWILWILIVSGLVFGFCYCSAECEKMQCPVGSKPEYFATEFYWACVCEPEGWRE